MISSQPGQEDIAMSKEEDNKAIVVRWFTEFWGKNVNLTVVDEIAAPDMRMRHRSFGLPHTRWY
jgi:hypothetical protein